jgi:hypothetical protein
MRSFVARPALHFKRGLLRPALCGRHLKKAQGGFLLGGEMNFHIFERMANHPRAQPYFGPENKR